ncbi:hypothetical protein LTR53_002536 [Teratosphaeriaceae sp. CCFEE 6253]|nr:hypothetical protein LTR53_002536 [Teratosphaeriaceae sp. CCFEE 6253]
MVLELVLLGLAHKAAAGVLHYGLPGCVTILAVLRVNKAERRKRERGFYPGEVGATRNKCRAMMGRDPKEYEQPVPYDQESPLWNRKQKEHRWQQDSVWAQGFKAGQGHACAAGNCCPQTEPICTGTWSLGRRLRAPGYLLILTGIALGPEHVD